MPLPEPGKNESKDDFLSRCHSAVADEFDDPAQRHAVCLKQWNDARTLARPGVELTRGLERRPYGWERRAVVAGTKSHPLIRGTAIVFNERSQDLGGFVEIIRPSAFERTVREGIDLRAFFDHDPAKVLGRQSAGTLTVKADRAGVHVEIDPPSQTDPPNLMESIARGDISGMSFAFKTMPEGDEWKRDGGAIVRYVTDMRVAEVSVVSMPAYEPTHVEVALRAMATYRQRMAPTVAQLYAQLHARAVSWSLDKR